jgi:hypothetical protein
MSRRALAGALLATAGVLRRCVLRGRAADHEAGRGMSALELDRVSVALGGRA